MVEDIQGRVKQILTRRIGLPPEQIAIDALLSELGVDSLDFVELTIAAEREFNVEISDELLQEVETVGDVVTMIERLVNERA